MPITAHVNIIHFTLLQFINVVLNELPVSDVTN